MSSMNCTKVQFIFLGIFHKWRHCAFSAMRFMLVPLRFATVGWQNWLLVAHLPANANKLLLPFLSLSCTSVYLQFHLHQRFSTAMSGIQFWNICLTLTKAQKCSIADTRQNCTCPSSCVPLRGGSFEPRVENHWLPPPSSIYDSVMNRIMRKTLHLLIKNFLSLSLLRN